MRNYCCRHLRPSSVLLLFIVVLIDFHAVLVAAESTAVVKTSTGPVQGVILSTVNSVPYAAFKGIPFAEPPLGFLRFKPPVPIKSWTTTLNASTDGANCMQGDGFSSALVGDIPNSEDCLFLNVHTTTTDLARAPTNLKPVMVWIYGGGFSTGTSSSKLYRPDYLLEKGVVFVAFNYRLGPLGFLSLNHKNATGNAGLKDQVLALKWVKENIAKFGGNPNNVTIFGQSAGSASVGYHILSDASAGLFQAAISMSGSPLNSWAFNTPAKALSRSIWLGSLLGTDSKNKETLLKTFYEASAEDLIAAASKMSPPTIFPFRPTFENKNIATEPFLTKCSIAKYLTGDFNKVPQMLGFMDDETMWFASAVDPIVGIVNEALDFADSFGIALPKSLALVKAGIDTTTAVVDLVVDKSLDALISETTDLLFKAGIDQTQQYFSLRNNGNPVYYYHVSFYTNTSIHNLISNNTLLGPAHTDDIAYIFYLPQANYSTDPTDPTRQTIDRVSTMWTNFAKYGDPTPSWVPEASVGITWPNSGLFGRALNIGNELSVVSRPTNANTKIIQAASSLTLSKSIGCFSLLFS